MKALDHKYHSKPLNFFLSVNRKDIKWLIINTLLYSTGQAAVFAAIYFLGRTIDELATPNGQIKLLLAALVSCVILYELFYRSGHMCEIYINARIRENTTKVLFDHTQSLEFGYFSDRFAGETAHKVVSTAEAFQRMSIIATNNFVEDGLLVLLSSVLLGFVNIYYGVFLAAWALLLVLGSWFLVREMNRRAAAYAAEEAKTTGSIVDVYGNIGTVKVYGKASSLNSSHRQIEKEKKMFLRLGWWDVLTYSYQGWLIILLCGGLILISSLLYGRDLVSLGSLVFVSGAALRLFNVSWGMGPNLAAFVRARGEVAQNLNDLVMAPAIVDGDHHKHTIHEDIGIEYRNVAFGYDENQLILDQFSITIEPGKKVGIVGLSGAGKTTFANLLLRFFDPQRGEILLNGIDIKNLTQESLRAHISHISQDTSLFHATIAENIAYGSEAASENDIRKAARLAYADEFINTLPNQYGSIVGERGIKLSGGQRQRIAIARAILADRPLFLLDEATSALDSDSEAKIQAGLTVLMENKTVIAIAHRLSTLSHMDRIVFLENGRIVEDGTHEELIARGDKYAKLWNMQAGGFLPS